MHSDVRRFRDCGVGNIVSGVFTDIYKLSRGRAITVLLPVCCEILLAGALVLMSL